MFRRRSQAGSHAGAGGKEGATLLRAVFRGAGFKVLRVDPLTPALVDGLLGARGAAHSMAHLPSLIRPRVTPTSAFSLHARIRGRWTDP